jgi:hypothetical protein
MTDKTLNIFLTLLLGLGGIAVSLLAWLQPMPVLGRILATFVGMLSLSWVVIRLPLMRSGADIDAVEVPAEVKNKDKLS